MNDVRLERLAGVYKFHIDDHDLTIRVDRLHDAKDATVAEISVYSTLPGMEESYFMPSSRINLGSALGRKGIAKELQESYNHIEWQETIKMICGTVLKYHRQGELVVKAGMGTMKNKGMGYLIEPTLAQNQANLIYGPGGTCKSYLSAFLCLLYHEQRNFGSMTTKSKGNALVLDFETSLEEFNHRINCLKLGMSFNPASHVFYRFCHQALQNDIESIAAMVLAHDVSLVVIDSYGMACGGDAWSQQIARDYYMALRSLHITTMTIDHVAKDNSKGSTPYGSVYKTNESRNVWQIESSQQVGEDRVQIALYHRKSNSSRLHHPIGLEFAFIDDDAVIIEPIDTRDSLALSQHLPLQERIADVLSRGAMPLEDIASELDAPEASVKTKLYQNKNRFIKLPNKSWGLKSQHEPLL